MRKALQVVAVMVMGSCVVFASAAWAQEKPVTQEKPATQEKPVPPAAQDKDKAAVAADPISGEWEGAVEMPDGAMPFALKLKLDKDKLTGEIGSQQGAVAISEGTFVEGKLTISFTYVDGNAVTMTGAVADGQLTGTLNYGGGQMVANWAAKKKVAK